MMMIVFPLCSVKMMMIVLISKCNDDGLFFHSKRGRREANNAHIQQQGFIEIDDRTEKRDFFDSSSAAVRSLSALPCLDLNELWQHGVGYGR